MSRGEAISRAREHFQSGAFLKILDRRVGYRTESQQTNSVAGLRAYLTDELQPAFDELDFTTRLVESPSGKGPFLFAEWRKDPDFVINDPRYAGASILLAGANFGSGSSREHAPWAIEDAGFRAIIAPSFADIFRNNCTKVGLLPVELRMESVRALMDAVLDDPTTRIVVDLKHRSVTAPDLDETFDIEQLVAGITEENRHDLVDTGAPKGREFW